MYAREHNGSLPCLCHYTKTEPLTDLILIFADRSCIQKVIFFIFERNRMHNRCSGQRLKLFENSLFENSCKIHLSLLSACSLHKEHPFLNQPFFWSKTWKKKTNSLSEKELNNSSRSRRRTLTDQILKTFQTSYWS